MIYKEAAAKITDTTQKGHNYIYVALQNNCMVEFELTPKLIKLLMHIKRKGFVTKDTRPFLASMRFYNYLWVLRDNGLIESNGNDKGNHQKIWRLSPKGCRGSK
jgi:hypothetical protein